MKKITVTKEELVKAFSIWNKEYSENEDEFENVSADQINPEKQANYLIEKIDEAKRQK